MTKQYRLHYREPGKRPGTERQAKPLPVDSVQEALDWMNANKDKAFLPASVMTPGNQWKRPTVVAILGPDWSKPTVRQSACMWKDGSRSHGSKSQDQASCPLARKTSRTMPLNSQATSTLMETKQDQTKQTSLSPAAQAAVGTVLEFKWTVSRGRDTYGYNICTLRDRFGKRLARCGGGYDMKGTCLGQWIQGAFQAELIALAQADSQAFAIYDEKGYRHPDPQSEYRPSEKLYGCCAHWQAGKLDHVSLDGGCGFSSMRDILNAIGLDLKWLHETKKTDLYEVVAKRTEPACRLGHT